MKRGAGHRDLPELVARAVAVGAAAGLVALWTGFVFRNPYADPAADHPALWVVYGIFVGLAVAGAIAAVRGQPGVVGLVGLISFVPVGLYLLLIPGRFRWTGVLDLVLMGAAVVMWRRSVATTPKGTEGE